MNTSPFGDVRNLVILTVSVNILFIGTPSKGPWFNSLPPEWTVGPKAISLTMYGSLWFGKSNDVLDKLYKLGFVPLSLIFNLSLLTIPP